MMQRATIIELAGRAFHVEEGGVAALETWLDTARARLADDPDRDELLADFERAIAARLEDAAPEARDVVPASAIDAALEAIGPVEPAATSSASTDSADAATTAIPAADPDASTGDDWRSRKLYRLTGDDSMLTGVCAGVAAYLRVDVTIVRLAFVVLALITSGVWAIVYIAMAIFVPEADTAGKRAAAHGYGDTANELIARARDGAGPALERAGRVLGDLWHAVAAVFHALALTAFWIVVAATAALAMLALAGLDGLTSPFDRDAPTWIVALFYSCAGWIVAAVALWLAMLSGTLDPRPRRRAAGVWHAVLGVTWAAAIAGVVAIPATHSNDIRDASSGHGRITLFDHTWCIDDEVDDHASICDRDRDFVVIETDG